jgi:hypothetical protein
LGVKRGSLRNFRLAALALHPRGHFGDLHSRGLLSEGCSFVCQGGKVVNFGQGAPTRG